ncbi:MAG TPA: hypothetical protein VKP68_11970, partial [Ramlibacter sp.]|nr:hypothetical protein [Ramlibacter sp.]
MSEVVQASVEGKHGFGNAAGGAGRSDQAAPVSQHLDAQADAVASEFGAQRPAIGPEQHTSLLVGMFGQLTALAI